MSKIILKKSAVVGKQPVTADLDYGELAINYADSKLYFKKSDNTIATIGGGTAVASSALQNRYSYTASATQTTFSASYTVPYVDVYLNGIRLSPESDYTATNGSSITLTQPTINNDLVEIVAQIASTTLIEDNTKLPLAGGTLTGTIGFAVEQTFPGTQTLLVSGTNIKTINGSSLLGSGNIQIDSGVTSFNTRTGAIALSSNDVTTALGFTPVTQTDINTSINAIIDAAPNTLDTLNELANALGDDPNFATSVTSSIAAKLPLAGGTMTGNIIFAGAQSWPTFNQNTTGTAAKATNIAGGSTGTIPYQSSADTTAQLAVGTVGQVLKSNAAAAPSWVNGTISGIALGNNLATLTFGTYLTGTSYNGSGAVTLATNATNANTASTIVARDASGNFSAGTITAALNGNASTATTASNVNNGTLTMNVSGTGLSGSQTFTANQAGNATFTVASNATNSNTGNAIVARDSNGDFQTGSINTTRALTDVSGTNAALRMVNPGGAAFYTSGGSGAIQIQLPATATGSMFRMTITVWTYDGQSFDICCGAYIYGGGIANQFAYMLTGSRAALNTRWGWDGTRHSFFIGNIGDYWNFPVVSVTDVQAGYQNYAASNWQAGWVVQLNNSSYGTVLSGPTLTSLLASTATTATNLAGGSAGTIPYQSAAGTTVQLAAGSSGQFLRSNGAAAPSWVAAPTPLSNFSIQKLSINLSSGTYWNTIDYLSETNGIMSLGGASSGGETLNPAYRFNPTNHQRVSLSLPSGITSLTTHASTRLLDGRIFVCGGVMNVYTNTAWIYSATANTWTTVANLPTAVKQHSAVTLADGRVLVVGGWTTANAYSTEFFLYTVGSNTWQTFTNPNTTTRRRFAAAALLGDGRVLFAGGQDSNGNINGSCFIFDPATNTFVTSGIPSLPRPLSDVGLCSMADGRVLAVGGRYTDSTFTAWDSSDSYIYSATTNTWTKSVSLPYPIDYPRMTAIGNGQILVTSGINNGYSSNGATTTAAVKEIFVFSPA